MQKRTILAEERGQRKWYLQHHTLSEALRLAFPDSALTSGIHESGPAAFRCQIDDTRLSLHSGFFDQAWRAAVRDCFLMSIGIHKEAYSRRIILQDRIANIAIEHGDRIEKDGWLWG